MKTGDCRWASFDRPGTRTVPHAIETAADQADDPPAHAGPVAGIRGPVRRKRRRRRLLVHVLADRPGHARAAARAEQGGLPGDRRARTAAGPARLRRRPGGGLVPADAARRSAVARPDLAAEASR